MKVEVVAGFARAKTRMSVRSKYESDPSSLLFLFSSVAKSKYYKLNPSKVQKPLTLSL